eukprot:jgi/Psemu1/41617/gm1.41617_g
MTTGYRKKKVTKKKKPPYDFASSIFIRKSKKPQNASDKLGLMNTRNNPLSSGRVPELLDSQVLYDRSKLANIEDDDDSVLDDNLFSPNNDDEEEVIDSKFSPCLSVDREGDNIAHVSDELKVKIKLMKIMQNHSIPLVAEKELKSNIDKVKSPEGHLCNCA